MTRGAHLSAPYKFVMGFTKAGQTIGELEALIAAYEPNAEFVHDRWAKTAVSQAIQAIKEGNIGVGGCIVKDKTLIFQDHNRQFVPYFRGDLHGEMVLMNQLEDSLKDEPSPNMRAYTIFTSQAPCPMCMLRLITSGVGKILHVYSDFGTPDQGHVSSIERLPPVWAELAKRQEIGEADCSPELKAISRQAFLLSVSVSVVLPINTSPTAWHSWAALLPCRLAPLSSLLPKKILCSPSPLFSLVWAWRR